MQQFIDDEQLDRQLREGAPYIDDGGFTNRVLQSLPARTAPARLRGTILVTVTLVATVLAYALSGGGRFVDGIILRMAGLPMLWLLAVALVAGLLMGVAGLTAALFKAREPELMGR